MGSDPEDDAADEVGVDGACGLDRAAGRLLDRLHDRPRLYVRKLVRGRELDRKPVLRPGDERIELGADFPDLTGTTLLGCEPDEIADQLVGVRGELLEHSGLP